jgi:hypothetical protein
MSPVVEVRKRSPFDPVLKVNGSICSRQSVGHAGKAFWALETSTSIPLLASLHRRWSQYLSGSLLRVQYKARAIRTTTKLDRRCLVYLALTKESVVATLEIKRA